MERGSRDWRWFRGASAIFLGLLVLAATLPNTGGIIAHPPPNLSMWRCGPFLFFPIPFFSTVGTVTISTACTVFGIARRNACEIVGWCLLGVLFAEILFIK
jgi:hypothetical protein